MNNATYLSAYWIRALGVGEVGMLTLLTTNARRLQGKQESAQTNYPRVRPRT